MNFFQGAFQIDPNATPDQIQRKRERINALMQRGGSARYVGEGLGDLASGVIAGIQGRKLDAVENRGRSEANDLFSRLISGASGSSESPISVLGPTPNIEVTTLPSEEQSVGAETREFLIRQGLIDRGLPEHVADGFIMNFRDESGLDPAINEVSPLVPGSRGGFGLSQWTGPRRVALENFASARGQAPSDLNTQLDFLLHELEGSESNAAKSIMATQDSSQAADAILRDFLRPAPEHVVSRSANYLGTQTPSPRSDNILAALANPWLSDEQKAILNDVYQRSQGAPGYQVLSAEEVASMGLPAGAYQRSPDGKISQIGGGGQNINISTGSESNQWGDPPKDHVWLLDEQGNVVTEPESSGRGVRPVAVPVAGGPEDNAQSNQEIAAKAQDGISLIDSILNDPALPSITGMIQGNLPPLTQGGTDLNVKIDQLKGQAFLQAFETLKGGGQITEREGIAAQNAMARLNRAQSTEAYMEALTELRTIMERAYARATGQEIAPSTSDDDLLGMY